MLYILAVLSDMVYFIKMFFEKIFGINKDEDSE